MKEPHINLRPATDADAGTWSRIIKDVKSTFYETLEHVALIRNYFTQVTALIIEVDGQPVGIIACRIEPGEVTIEEFAVQSSHQGKGYGSVALGKVLIDQITLGHKYFRTYVHPGNDRAIALLNTFGFMEKGEVIPDFQETRQPRIEMVRNLIIRNE